MTRFLVLILISLFVRVQAVAQVEPIAIGKLDDALSEPSGIAIIYNESTGQFDYWMHNDYDYPDSIFSFRLDELMEPSRVLDIGEAYYDWEDITTDEDSNLYLGDFGNWTPNDELQIIKIPDPNSFATLSPPSSEVIRYEYPFDGVTDMEAMFHHEDYLYLLSKTVRPDINPNLNEDYTYLFRIPESSNLNGTTHIAELVDELQLTLPGDPDDARIKITGAEVSPDGEHLMLLGYERCWLFSCFEGNDFFGGEVAHFAMNYRQYEGVAFVNNHEVIISKEGSRDDPNYNPILYHLDLAPLLPSDCLDCNKVINGGFEEVDLAWTLFMFGGGTAEVDLELNGGRAELHVNQLSSSQWHANLRHKGIVLEKDRTYNLSYTAYADQPATISIIMNKADGSQGYFYNQSELSTQPTLFSHQFTMDETTDFNSYLSFNVGNSALTSIYFDDVSLVDECTMLTTVEEPIADEEMLLLIIPNPVSDVLEIEYEAWSSGTVAELYDGSGMLVGRSNEKRLSVNALSRGIYIVVLKKEGVAVGSGRFVKI